MGLHKPSRYRDASLPYHADSRQRFPRSQEAVAHYRATTSRVSLGRILLQKGPQLRFHGPADDSLRALAEYPGRRQEQFLTKAEFDRLGKSLGQVETEGEVSVSAVAAIRLLILTGCRKSEILTLRWEDVDRTAGELRLRDAKAGPRMVPLTAPVLVVLDGIPRLPDNPWVIMGRKPDSHLPDVHFYWMRICERAELDDVRIHDLRHSYASKALALGESLPVMGLLKKTCFCDSVYRYFVIETGRPGDVGTEEPRSAGVVHYRFS